MQLAVQSFDQYESTRCQLSLAEEVRSFGQTLNGFQINAEIKVGDVSDLSSLKSEKQTQILEFLKFYRYLLSDLRPSASSPELPSKEVPESVDQEIKALQVCARRLGVVFSDDLLARVSEDDIVEIYTADLIQIYRSFRFFGLCSYSLTDLLSNEWFDLYERSVVINNYLFEAGKALMERTYDLSPINLSHIPIHLMREKISTEKRSFQIQFKEMYPVYQVSGGFYGYIIVQGAKPVVKVDPSIRFL